MDSHADGDAVGSIPNGIAHVVFIHEVPYCDAFGHL